MHFPLFDTGLGRPPVAALVLGSYSITLNAVEGLRSATDTVQQALAQLRVVVVARQTGRARGTAGTYRRDRRRPRRRRVRACRGRVGAHFRQFDRRCARGVGISDWEGTDRFARALAERACRSCFSATFLHWPTLALRYGRAPPGIVAGREPRRRSRSRAEGSGAGAASSAHRPWVEPSPPWPPRHRLASGSTRTSPNRRSRNASGRCSGCWRLASRTRQSPAD